MELSNLEAVIAVVTGILAAAYPAFRSMQKAGLLEKELTPNGVSSEQRTIRQMLASLMAGQERIAENQYDMGKLLAENDRRTLQMSHQVEEVTSEVKQTKVRVEQLEDRVTQVEGRVSRDQA